MTDEKIEILIEKLKGHETIALIKEAREAIEEMYEDIKNLEDKLYEG